MIALAQEVYQRWLTVLDPAIQPFFIAAHDSQPINQAIEQCKNPEDVIVLAESHGFQLSAADLESAAIAASQVEGFSFEKHMVQTIGAVVLGMRHHKP